jgi:predicted permease
VTPPPRPVIAWCDTVLRAASRLAPSDVRSHWLREWRAEVHYALARQQRLARASRTTDLQTLTRCGGAFVHAAWLRWDRWSVEMLLQELKYAMRGLIKRPGFAVITILTLAIGIGANAAIFSAVRAVLLRPLPFPNPDEIVQVYSTSVDRPNAPGGTSSPPDFVDLRRQNAAFSEMAAVSAGAIPWTGYGAAEQVPYAMVTGGFFNVLGVPALYGRSLGYEDDAAGSAEVVVISHALWVRRFGGDPAVLGRTMMLDAVPRRIVGIMPAGFEYPLSTELWMPLRFTADDLATQRGAHYLDVIARRKPGIGLDASRADLDTVAQRLRVEYPSTNGKKAIAAFPLREAIVGDVKPALLVLLAAVGFVLLIVCVNVAGLSLTRAVGRTRELAVRAALGAGRARLINGLLVESAAVAACGGAAGLLLAYWLTAGIAALDVGLGIPLLDQTRIDGTVLLFTAAVSLLAAVLFGTLPAWHASGLFDVARRIREEATSLTGHRERQRLRGALIVAETALAVVLLVGAGLLMRSFMRMASVELGFDTDRLQTFSLSLPEMRYATPPVRAAFIESLTTQLAVRPEVEAVGAVFGLPLTNFSYGITTSTLDGRRLTDAEQDARSMQVRVVTPDYFRAIGIPLIRGRSFTSADRLNAENVVIVNQAAAARLWPDADPLGHQFTLGTRLGQGGRSVGGTVIGVARDVREAGPARPIRPTIYVAHAQFPVDFVSVVMRTRADAASAIEPARAIMSGLDANVPMFRVRSMEQLAATAVARPRLYLLLIGLFAGAAVFLAAIGIYGVLMHAVTQRTREIGIRLALGARRGEVVAIVVRQAVALAFAGLGLGLVLALGAGRYIQALLFGIEPTDTLTYVGVAGALLAIAAVASYLPARRASRIDPMRALRYE